MQVFNEIAFLKTTRDTGRPVSCPNKTATFVTWKRKKTPWHKYGGFWSARPRCMCFLMCLGCFDFVLHCDNSDNSLCGVRWLLCVCGRSEPVHSEPHPWASTPKGARASLRTLVTRPDTIASTAARGAEAGAVCSECYLWSTLTPVYSPTAAAELLIVKCCVCTYPFKAPQSNGPARNTRHRTW